MSHDPLAKALVLTGPTASGKSALALTLAERLGGEIVSMDSMTLYRGLDIGTAKPTTEERQRVPHHLIDVLDPWESASVAWWLERATACCREILARGKRPLLVGGTGLYLKAVLCGLFDGPPADEEVRGRLSAEAEWMSPESLHARLAQVDPVSAVRLHPHDVRRVIRALEVWELTGKPISSWQTQWRNPLTPNPSPPQAGERGDKTFPLSPACGGEGLGVRGSCRAIWLNLPRDTLYARINARVAMMIAGGLVEEVRSLRQLPHPMSREAAQALGYKEVFDHLDGRATLAATIERIQTRSRNFAKRQVTWFRHLPGLKAVGPTVSEELTIRGWDLTMVK